MGFSFSTIEPNQLGRITKFDIPMGEWMGLKFSQAFNDSLGMQFTRFHEELAYDDYIRVRPDVANRAYGIEGHLKFDEPISIQRARLMHERKRAEVARMALLESASHSWASAKAVVGFGAAMVGSLAHPMDLGLTFLPFIGSEKAAAQVAKVGGSSWRQALQRGVIAEETLAARGVPFHRLTGAVIDGIVNQAAMEIPIAIQKHRDQAAYGIEDSVFNVVAGGAFAGAIKGIGLALERAGKLWTELDVRTKDAVIADTAISILTGDTPKGHWAVGVDEATLRARAEERVRAENPFSEEEALRARGELEEPTVKLPEDLELIAQKEARGAELSGSEAAKVEALIDPTTPQAHSEYQARVSEIEENLSLDTERMNEVRRQSIEDYLNRAKTAHEAKVKGLIDEETRRVIDEVKRQSPPLPAEEAKKYSFKTVPDDANIKAVEEDAADFERQVLNIARTPEERVQLEARIKTELKALDENGMSGEKAIDDMVPCVVERSKS